MIQNDRAKLDVHESLMGNVKSVQLVDKVEKIPLNSGNNQPVVNAL